jgi:predicted kinase
VETPAGRRPTLLLVSGAPGSGKTRLSLALADTLGLFRLSKAEIARGLDATDRTDPTNHDRGWATYWTVLETLLEAGVSVIADQTTWRGQCDPIIRARLLPRASARIVHCVTPLAQQRWLDHLRHQVGLPADELEALRERMHRRRTQFELPLPLDRPVLEVDTTAGYSPGLDRVVAFASADL